MPDAITVKGTESWSVDFGAIVIFLISATLILELRGVKRKETFTGPSKSLIRVTGTFSCCDESRYFPATILNLCVSDKAIE
ncbi:MAG: hypothetical protein WDO06_05135 [Actinomycetota bacterium]